MAALMAALTAEQTAGLVAVLTAVLMAVAPCWETAAASTAAERTAATCFKGGAGRGSELRACACARACV